LKGKVDKIIKDRTKVRKILWNNEFIIRKNADARTKCRSIDVGEGESERYNVDFIKKNRSSIASYS